MKIIRLSRIKSQARDPYHNLIAAVEYPTHRPFCGLFSFLGFFLFDLLLATRPLVASFIFLLLRRVSLILCTWLHSIVSVLVLVLVLGSASGYFGYGSARRAGDDG